MNRRQFLTLAASVGVSAALPAIPMSIGQSPAQPMLDEVRLFQELSQHIANAILYGNSHPEIYQFNGFASLPLDSRREPCDASVAGRDQIG